MPADSAVTVVVPARNASRTIAGCLHAIGQLKPAPARVVVLDDHSSDATAVLARAGGAVVIPVPDPGGLGVARNLAIRECKTGYLGYLNADCYPEPGWLGALLDAARRQDAVLVGGAQHEVRGGTVAERWKARHLRQDLGDQPVSDPDFLSGGNLLLDTGRLGAVRFDHRYRSAYEDVDFCRRLRAAGGRLYYEPGAVVSHDHAETVGTLPRKVWSYGASSNSVGPVSGLRGALRAFIRMHSRPHDQVRNALRDDLSHGRVTFLCVDVMLFAASLWYFISLARQT